MKVLYLTYDGLLDPLGQSQILPYLYGLAEALPLTFHIISFEKAERRSGEAALRKELTVRGIHWHSLSFTRQPPLLSKAYDSWRFHAAAQQIVTTEGIRLLHARSYVAGWVAHRLSQQYGLPWIFDMRGFWADERRETAVWRPGHPFYDWLYWTWKRREQLMLTSATHVVVLTDAARQVLIKWGIPPQKVSVIPCVADYEHFTPRPSARSVYRFRLGIPSDAIVLGYVGSIGPLYGLREMLRLFTVLLRIEPNSYMVFLTPASSEAVHAAAREEGILADRLRVHFSPRHELPSWMSVMDFSVVFYQPGFSRAGTSPTRIAELLAMNIPVIIQGEVGDNAYLAAQINGLYVCEAFTDAAYEKVLRRLLTDKKEGSLSSPRETSRQFLSLPIGHERYRALYQQLMDLNLARLA